MTEIYFRSDELAMEAFRILVACPSDHVFTLDHPWFRTQIMVLL
jgi:hypothetical protein